MLAFVFILNYACCLVCALAVLRRLRPERETLYVELFESFVAGTLLFCVEVFFFIEILSFLNLLRTPGPLALLFFVSLAALAVVTFSYRTSLLQFLAAWKAAPSESSCRKTVCYIALLIFLPLLFIAVCYPPCTADSMSYHLPRILHWIQNGNVSSYPTNYNRQLFVQPFGEYLVLPWELMTGGDWFDNTVQIVALFGVLLLTALLIRHFGGKARCQLLGIALVLSSPIVLFEAPTTQTDIIVTFFFFAFIYSGLKLSSAREWNDLLVYAIGMGVSLGLSLNTKLSVAPFELVFCPWFAWRFLAVHRRKVWAIYAILVAGFLIFNVPYLYRNYQISGSPFGAKHLQDQVKNLRFGPDVVFSNSVRNIGMQLLVPFQGINQFNFEFLSHLHRELGIAWDDPQISFTGMGTVPYPYTPQFLMDDYRSGNTLIIMLVTIVSLALGGEAVKRFLFPAGSTVSTGPPKTSRKKERKKTASHDEPLSAEPTTVEPESSLLFETPAHRDMTVYIWLMFFGFILFSSMFRWQPFGSRLLMPVFLGAVPFVAVELCRMMESKLIRRLTLLCLGVSTLLVVFAVSNSLFYDPLETLIHFTETEDPDAPADPASSTSVKEPRQVISSTSVTNIELVENYFRPDRTWFERICFQRNYKYFRTVKHYVVDYLSMTNKIKELGAVKIGMALDPVQDRWEYPFWPILRSQTPEVQIKWVIYPDYLKKSRNYDPDFMPDVVITDYEVGVIQEKYDIDHAWKYNNIVLAKVRKKGTAPNPVESETKNGTAEERKDTPEDRSDESK